MKLTSTELFFTQFASNYDARTAVNGYQAGAWVTQILKSEHQAQAALKIFDVGCGTGKIGSMMRQIFPQAVIEGVDFSAAMLNLSKKTKAYDDLFWLDLNKNASTLRPGPFDVIVCMAVSEYMSAPLDLLQILGQRLTERGSLLISFLDSESFVYRWEEKQAPIQSTSVKRAQVMEEFARQGLELVQDWVNPIGMGQGSPQVYRFYHARKALASKR